MPAERFLDTNVVVYSFDVGSPTKRAIARSLLDADDTWVSWQVIQEFSSVALHKFEVPLRPADLADYLSLRLWPKCRVFPSESIQRAAIELHARHGFRIYDALIVASALAGGATKLLTEDLQHGQRIGPLEVVNPFLDRG